MKLPVSAELPGIDLDAANARKIAVAMGLPPLNMSEISNAKLTDSLDVMAKDARGPQVLYIAASNDTQESFATRQGRVGTLAWAHCIGLAGADADRCGRINGEELRECAQSYIDSPRTKQTIMLQGNAKLPIAFVQTAAATPAFAPAPTARVRW